jgi:RimJ/RimL family protein N-acetyltransferase
MTKPSLPLLVDATLKLRAPKPDDALARLRLGRDAEIIRMYGGSRADIRPMTMEEASRWVDALMSQDYTWVIENAGELAGHIRLDRVDFRDRRASLAVGIDDPTLLGKGIGTRAIMLVQEFAFRSLKLHRLSVRVVSFNLRAIRAYEKCGFVIEGTEREAAFVDSEWYDDLMMGILDREYETSRQLAQ